MFQILSFDPTQTWNFSTAYGTIQTLVMVTCEVETNLVSFKVVYKPLRLSDASRHILKSGMGFIAGGKE
jgi:hypothetical protein